MDADLDTLATALYVRTDELLKPRTRAAAPPPTGRDRTAHHGRGVGHPRGVGGAAAIHQRGSLAALRPWAEYGYCASHSRYFLGLRLHLIATVHGLPVGFALTGAKAERQVLLSVLPPTRNWSTTIAANC